MAASTAAALEVLSNAVNIALGETKGREICSVDVALAFELGTIGLMSRMASETLHFPEPSRCSQVYDLDGVARDVWDGAVVKNVLETSLRLLELAIQEGERRFKADLRLDIHADQSNELLARLKPLLLSRFFKLSESL